MAATYPSLFRPGQIGTLRIKNRLVMAAMDLGYARDGAVTDRLIDFYVERAQGGVGLIVIGGFAVSPAGVFGHDCLLIDQDRLVPGIQRLTAALRPHGPALFCQLFHAGRDANPTGMETLAPSPIQSRLNRRVPRELTEGEIARIIQDYGSAAGRAREAGFDGVEVLAGGGFLISQFLSPLSNVRQDRYGGDPEHRLRFLLEVIAAVRDATGEDFPIQVRLTGDDLLPGGVDHQQAKGIAARLEQAGVDGLSIHAGWEESKVPTSWCGVPRGAFVYMAEGFKDVVRIPVTTCNRINNPDLADQILREGRADFVAMARPYLADPELPRKAQEGRAREISPCIACNQGCLDTIFAGGIATCLVNPAAGHEQEFRLVSAPHPKRVVVAGGGPAGIEAARTLARRGHTVTLLERSQRLGGQLNLAAASPPKAEEFRAYLDFLEQDLCRHGVDVRLGTEATVEAILRLRPDAAVIATGSRPRRPEIPGIDLPHVVHAHEVLAGTARLGPRVAIIGAHGTGCDTALLLAGRAAAQGAVTLLRRTGRVADDLGKTVRWVVLQELAEAGVQSITDLAYEAITPGGIRIVQSGQAREIPADTVVIAAGMEPDNRLAAALQGLVPELHLAGDAAGVRDALAAVREGAVLGRRI